MADLDTLVAAMRAARHGDALPDTLFADVAPAARFPQPDTPRDAGPALSPRERLAARATTQPAPEPPIAPETDVQPPIVDDQAAFEARMARLGLDEP